MYQPFTEQQLEIRDLVRNFVKKEITHEVAIHWDEENKAPVELLARMRKELGISGLVIPEEYGGLGMGAVDSVLP